MPVSAQELLEAAQVLAQQPSEIWLRSAISRAYYASYHRCRAWERSLPEPGFNVGGNGGRHQELINRLQHPAPRCGEELRSRSRSSGFQLAAQRARRVQADYDLDDVVSVDAVDKQLEEARQVLARCDLPMPARR